MKRNNVVFTILAMLWFAVEGQSYPGSGNAPDMLKIGVLSGKVKDVTTGNFVEYTTVSLYRQKDSTLVTGTITKPDGSFILNELPFGMFYLDASFVGYKTTRLTKIVLSPKTPVVDIGTITIEPSATALEAVEVVGNRPAIEYKIDKKVIAVDQSIVASGGTAVDVLENVPSVQVDVEGNVSLRGSSNFTVLIDGKPSVLKGSEALQQFPAASIENIEIITNPSAKYDPEGSGGIINIIMKKQKQSGISGIVNASVSTNGSYGGNFLINLRKNKMNYFLGGNYNIRKFGNTMFSDIRKFHDDTTGYEINHATGEFDRNGMEIRGGIDYNLSPQSTLSLSGSYNERVFGRTALTDKEKYSAPTAGEDIYSLNNSDFEVHRNYYELNLDFQQKFNDSGHQLLTSLRYTDEYSNEINNLRIDTTDQFGIITGIDPYLEHTREWGDETEFRAKVDYTLPINENSKFEAGYQADYEKSTEDYRFETYLSEANYWQENLNRRNDGIFSEAIHSLYAIYSNSTKFIDYQLGLRTEYDDRLLKQELLNRNYPFTKWDLFPSVHLSRKLPKDFQVQASYSRRIERPRQRYLDPFEVYVDPDNVRVGNPALEPEYVNSYELNMQKSLKGQGFVSLETFHRQTVNLISRFRRLRPDNIMENTFENINKDFSTGIEIMANVPLAKWWIFNASLSMFDYRIRGDVSSNVIDENTFSWNARANSMFRFKWGLQAQITGFYNAPSITPQGTREGFFFTNIGIRQDLLKRKLTLALQARDLFGSSKFRFTSSGPNFTSVNEFKRESQIITLALTYRINNYKQKNRKNGDQNMNEIEFNSDGGDIY